MASESQKPLLEVKDLTVRFHTGDGVVKAVNGVSYTLNEGETLGVVGESGCGKSVHARSILGLIPMPPGKIEKGEIWYDGRNLLDLHDNDMYQIRGPEIAMVFQDPMTFLNPVLTVGFQVSEASGSINKWKKKRPLKKQASYYRWSASLMPRRV